MITVKATITKDVENSTDENSVVTIKTRVKGTGAGLMEVALAELAVRALEMAGTERGDITINQLFNQEQNKAMIGVLENLLEGLSEDEDE